MEKIESSRLNESPIVLIRFLKFSGIGHKKIKLEIVQGVKSARKKAKASTAPISENDMVHTGLGLVLDELRQNLAAVHGGIFPHSVLSSQHISLLSSQKPLTMEEVRLMFLVLCSDAFL